jgi:hypothetical protein
MDEKLQKLAEHRYSQKEFLNTLHELALAEQWADMQHLVQHDMAKAILADYSYINGKDYLDTKIFYTYWEEVIAVGWEIFCERSGISGEHIRIKLSQLHETI